MYRHIITNLIFIFVIFDCYEIKAENNTEVLEIQKEEPQIVSEEMSTKEALSNQKLDEIISNIEKLENQKEDSKESSIEAIVVALIAAAVALIGTFTTLGSNKKTRKSAEEASKKSNSVLKKISQVEAKTQDKQRLVEVISSQRVEWINNVRTLFAEFNTKSYIFTSAVRQKEE